MQNITRNTDALMITQKQRKIHYNKAEVRRV